MSYTAIVWLSTCVSIVLIAWAWAFARKATAAQAKAEVYREIAAAWGMLRDVSWMKNKQRQKAERIRAYLRLALCSPDVCDALREALDWAEDYWKHPAARERIREQAEREIARAEKAGAA